MTALEGNSGMWKIFFTIITLVCSINFATAQEKPLTPIVGNGRTPSSQQANETEPQFPGGQQLFIMQIYNSFDTEVLIKNQITKSKAIISFYVEPNGKMSDIKIKSYDHEPIKAELLKVVPSIKTKWIPSESKGRKIRKLVEVPLLFNLNLTD